jgi:hypothetical protein
MQVKTASKSVGDKLAFATSAALAMLAARIQQSLMRKTVGGPAQLRWYLGARRVVKFWQRRTSIRLNVEGKR